MCCFDSLLPFPLFLLCPPPPSPPFLTVQVGSWLPFAKNSICHLRSAYAVLHRCHNTDPHAAAQTLFRASFRKLQPSLLFFPQSSVNWCFAETLLTNSGQSYSKIMPCGDEFKCCNFLNYPFSRPTLNLVLLLVRWNIL